MYKEHVYSIKLSEYVTTLFVGSIYVFFNSKENLAVPFVLLSRLSNQKIVSVLFIHMAVVLKQENLIAI